MSKATLNWVTVELLGYSFYSNKGYRILIPLVKNNYYDFVAEKDNEFIRVNVKIAGLKDKNIPHSWSINLSGGSHDVKEWRYTNVDIFLAWIPTEERFIEVPSNIFAGSASKAKRIPRELLIR
jgi:hypothetical protein